MSWTKKQLINQAYSLFGLSNYVYSLTPEQFETSLNMLDSMMAALATTEGIRIGYNGSATQGLSDPDQDSGIPDFANEAVAFKLAVRLQLSVGRLMQPAFAVEGKNAYDALVSWCMSNSIPEMQYARDTPRGSGNKPYRGSGAGIFFQPAQRLDTGAGDSFVDMSDGSAIVTGADTFTYP